MSDGLWFMGSYKDPNEKALYGCQIFAKNIDEARALAKLRNMGEKLDGIMLEHSESRFVPPSVNMLKPETKPSDVVHALSWLGNLAIASGACKPRDVLADTGFLHQYAHFLTHELYADDVWMTSKLRVRDLRQQIESWKRGGPPPTAVAACARQVAEIEAKIPGFLPRLT